MIICHLPPFRGIRNNHWTQGLYSKQLSVVGWATFKKKVQLFQEWLSILIKIQDAAITLKHQYLHQSCVPSWKRQINILCTSKKYSIVNATINNWCQLAPSRFGQRQNWRHFLVKSWCVRVQTGTSWFPYSDIKPWSHRDAFLSSCCFLTLSCFNCWLGHCQTMESYKSITDLLQVRHQLISIKQRFSPVIRNQLWII